MPTDTIVRVTPENVETESLFCIKNTKLPGYKQKLKWFNKRFDEGLHLLILKNEDGKAIAFIEFIPAEFAWRPVDADNYMFIQCMYVYSKKDKQKGLSKQLLTECEKEAKKNKMYGICTMTSKGSWLADQRFFSKYNFEQIDQRGRFELMIKKFKKSNPDPRLINWESKQKKYQGWHLLYADQCPWHEKSARVIKDVCTNNGVDIQIKKINTSKQAKSGPSGFGVFSLVHDGKLLSDHYISETRFKTILKKELQ